MNIICSALYEEQLKEILEEMIKEDYKAAKSFKLYLDTILLNIPTKSKKYKPSRYFDDQNIKDVDHQGFIIPFFEDVEKKVFVILGIVRK